MNILDRIARMIVRKWMKPNLISKDLFLPTHSYHILKQLAQNIPHSHIIIADYDDLISSIPGINSPIVSKKGLKSA